MCHVRCGAGAARIKNSPKRPAVFFELPFFPSSTLLRPRRLSKNSSTPRGDKKKETDREGSRTEAVYLEFENQRQKKKKSLRDDQQFSLSLFSSFSVFVFDNETNEERKRKKSQTCISNLEVNVNDQCFSSSFFFFFLHSTKRISDLKMDARTGRDSPK